MGRATVRPALSTCAGMRGRPISGLLEGSEGAHEVSADTDASNSKAAGDILDLGLRFVIFIFRPCVGFKLIVRHVVSVTKHCGFALVAFNLTVETGHLVKRALVASAVGKRAQVRNKEARNDRKNEIRVKHVWTSERSKGAEDVARASAP